MIELLNTKPGDIYSQSIIQLFGQCFDNQAEEITVINTNGLSTQWKITNNYFKVNKLFQYQNLCSPVFSAVIFGTFLEKNKSSSSIKRYHS